MSEISHIRDFSAQVSQFFFLAYFTALPLITTVWVEISEKSYLCDFSAQVLQIVISTFLTVLRLLRKYDLKYQQTQISAISVHKWHKSFS